MGRLEETLGYGSRRELAVRFFATFSSLPSLPLAYEVPEGRRMLGRAARSGKRRKRGGKGPIPPSFASLARGPGCCPTQIPLEKGRGSPLLGGTTEPP